MTAYQIFEIASLSILLLILALDLLLVVRRPHVPSMRESSLWVAFYVSLALVFAGILFFVAGGRHSGDFLTGWLLEYSLSIDNLFVFVILIARFGVPRVLQQRVLMAGIIIAIVLRGIFILLGVQLIENLSWIFYLFAAWLIYAAWRQAFGPDEDEGLQDNALVRLLRRRVNLTDDWHGGRVRVQESGMRAFTPMLLVLIALGTTDLLFAVDSIPAIFSVTQDPFLVFACNIFALMGLRQLYFMLGGLLDRLVYLHYGIAFLLAFIGVKLTLHALHHNELPFLNGGEPLLWVPTVPTWLSLVVIVLSMVVATVTSLVARRAAVPVSR
ncbi:TerC family protein [Ornithinimicrobium cavernae]|uniref:TerC family protein n=1 Tax=Ornithinimicrobium cavernae TaxID=2666047 RepID=UPI000D686BBD|nr:TerC family protein [Ornithinimicrobium cavernae]